MDNDQESRGPEDLGQHPFVEKLRPDPSQPPERLRILEGLLGDSDREGYKRLYFTRKLDYHAEFRAEDVLFSEPIPPERTPLVGLEATRVGTRWEASIEYTRLKTPRPVDEFDLDIRFAALGRRGRRSSHDTTRICCIDDPQTQCEDCTQPDTGCAPCTQPDTGCAPCTQPDTGCVQCTQLDTGCAPCTQIATGCPDVHGTTGICCIDDPQTQCESL